MQFPRKKAVGSVVNVRKNIQRHRLTINAITVETICQIFLYIFCFYGKKIEFSKIYKKNKFYIHIW